MPQNCAKAIILDGGTVSWRNLKVPLPIYRTTLQDLRIEIENDVPTASTSSMNFYQKLVFSF